MLEKESKFWPVRRAVLASRLSEEGSLTFSGVIRNRYFVFPHAAPDTLIRIRCFGPSIILGAKGPRLPGDAKIREEFECSVASEEDAAAFLLALGSHEPHPPEERIRQEWTLPDGTRVCIDRLADPRVPDYAEVEADSIERISQWAGILGLADEGVRSGSQTFEELAALFGVTIEDISRPLPPGMRANVPQISECWAKPVRDAVVTETALFVLSGGEGDIEAGERWASARFGGVSLLVDSVAALKGLLRLVGARSLSGGKP
jgi:adenylate cyclase class IV